MMNVFNFGSPLDKKSDAKLSDKQQTYGQQQPVLSDTAPTETQLRISQHSNAELNKEILDDIVNSPSQQTRSNDTTSQFANQDGGTPTTTDLKPSEPTPVIIVSSLLDTKFGININNTILQSLNFSSRQQTQNNADALQSTKELDFRENFQQNVLPQFLFGTPSNTKQAQNQQYFKFAVTVDSQNTRTPQTTSFDITPKIIGNTLSNKIAEKKLSVVEEQESIENSLSNITLNNKLIDNPKLIQLEEVKNSGNQIMQDKICRIIGGKYENCTIGLGCIIMDGQFTGCTFGCVK